MIALISGKLVNKTTESAVIDVNGVGYEAFIPLSTYYRLPETGERVSLNVYTHLKDDAIVLYGFMTGEEKDAFTLLIGVTGIGPKAARNILSGIAVEDLVAAVAASDKARLSTIPGIGAKSAERLIMELRDKVRDMASAASPGRAKGYAEKDGFVVDVASALVNLGYKAAEAEDAVRKAKDASPGAHGFEALFKEALKTLSKR